MNRSQSMKAVIFDCDGTLVDSEPFHYLAWKAAFEKWEYLLEKEFYIQHFSGVCDRALLKISRELLKENHSDEILDHKHQFFQDYLAIGIAPLKSTVEFAGRLFQHKEAYGLKLAVASGALKKEILHHLKVLQIDHYFDVILSGADDLAEYQDPEGTNKPKPYVYLKTAKLLGLKPEECVAIEDTRTGVSSAVTAGCFTIAIPNEYTQHHDLSQAHIKLPSLAGMSIDDFLKMSLSCREFFKKV